MFQPHGKSILQEIHHPLYNQKEVRVFIKRDDLLHPQISGNKWRKLKYNLDAALKANKETLLSFGGAYSNHIFALAAAAKEVGLPSVGCIRGEEQLPLNSTLQFALDCGMQLHYISRGDYRHKNEPQLIEQLRLKFGDFMLIPEGGTNNLAIQGCSEITNEIDIPFNYICTAVGTGGTISGLIASCNKNIIGFSVLKGEFLTNEVAELLKGYGIKNTNNWTINNNFHFGGYAKITDELIAFIRQFKLDHNVLLDPIYTGKMMFGMEKLISMDYFEKNSTIIAIHTGGLQGWHGIKERYGIEI